MPSVAHLCFRWHVTDASSLIEIPDWLPENGRGICGTLLLRKTKSDDEPSMSQIPQLCPQEPDGPVAG